ncbi:MAG: CbtA family protein, partial [Alphaproteobacteria bacterium]|nr:CbtA family protein [Alphaproteobacteria bacterium]
MALLGRILLPAVIAGILSGALLTGLQHVEVIPLIYQAETFENSATVAAGHAHDGEASGVHEAEPWAPDDGIERTSITLLANIVAAVGFGLLLSVACSRSSSQGGVVQQVAKDTGANAGGLVDTSPTCDDGNPCTT